MPDRIALSLQPTYQITASLFDSAGALLAFGDTPGQIDIQLQAALRGEKGDPGSSTSRYVHTQSSSAATWTVAHNLNAQPSITVSDHLNRQIWADVTYVDQNIVQVTHATPLTGFVYCN